MISGPRSRLGESDMFRGSVLLFSIAAGELQCHSSTSERLMESSRAGLGQNSTVLSSQLVAR